MSELVLKQKKSKNTKRKSFVCWKLQKKGGGWKKEDVEISSNFLTTTDFSFSSQKFFQARQPLFLVIYFSTFLWDLLNLESEQSSVIAPVTFWQNKKVKKI